MNDLFPFGDCRICGRPAIERPGGHLYCDRHWRAYLLQLDEAFAALGDSNNHDSDCPS